MKKFVIILLLIVSLNSCDPGWNYYLIKPPLENEGERNWPGYNYKDDSLNIFLTAFDFGFHTNTYIKIGTPLDSVLIYPNFSYITSPHYPDIKHAPYLVDIKCFSKDSLIFENEYWIDDINRGSYLVRVEAWEKDSVIIRKDHVTGEKISKDGFLKPYYLYLNDSLIVHFRYKGFGSSTYNKRNRFFPFWPFTAEKSDFIFHYDIYGNKNLLIFHFSPEKSGEETK